MREKDEINKGKDDWMNYQNKLKQIKEDQNLDKDNNEKIAQRKLAKKEKEAAEGKKPARKSNPDGGFQLG